MALAKGGTPTILYQRFDITELDIREVLAVTDDYVIATAFWWTGNTLDAEGLWGLVEVPRTGEPPVLVETFGANVAGVYAAAIPGDDGYFYYAADLQPWGTGSSGSVMLQRVSATHFGEPVTTIASVPGSYWNTRIAVDDDHVYVASEWGIGRVPKEGGALEVLVGDHGPASAELPNSIAVHDGFVYYSVYPNGCTEGVLERVPIAGGTPQTIAGRASRVVFGGSPTTLFAAHDKAVLRFDASQTTATTLLTTDTGRYQTIELVGTRLHAVDRCLDTGPDGAQGGSFVRTYDIETGTTGYLEDEPDYPFVPGPTGIAHDAGGQTIFYIE
ncbi:hypothetical protein A7982_13923 [Minicystis rosea]|nr:hypothetical protein A7982_13923 [Minicystis rosea]